MQVPFLDLKAQYESIRSDVAQAIQDVIDRTAFAGGPFVRQFEEEFAEYCETEYAVGVGSGTEALWLALAALNCGPGDEVITVPNTFIATVEAISFAGARPVFVDVDEETATLDPGKLEAAITPNTRAIIPVHLYGQVADMDPICEIAGRHGIPVIEDAAQAHGARYKGRAAGSIGTIGCFSFYPGKNLGAYGEAGAITTRDEGLAREIEKLRDHGQSAKYHHDVVGWNARMDGVQGAVLSVKLKRLDEWNDRRRAHAATYDELLAEASAITVARAADYGVPVYHIYAIRVDDRGQTMDGLKEAGIGCGIHYPVPVHLTGAYSSLGLPEGTFPVAEAWAATEISLPMFAELTTEQIRYVTETVARAAGVFV